MIYFFTSSRKSDNLTNPVTICSNNERRATSIAILKFLEWGYKGSPVRIVVTLLLMFCMSANVSAQNYTREGNTYISSTGERTRTNNAIETAFKVKESGREYVVYCSKSTGACFIKKISRNGKEYKKYLGEEISRQICTEIGIEYKSKRRNDNN